MLIYWNGDPELLRMGWLTVRWYGLLFAAGFLVGLKIMQWMYEREGRAARELDQLLLYVMAGTLIGARLIHCFFYEPEYYLRHPVDMLFVWRGGLASHGGAIGLLAAVWLYCRSPQRPGYWWLLDRIAVPATLAGAFIRIGNFFNSEIIGIPTNQTWGVVFQHVDDYARHPAQLYEASVYLFIFWLLLRTYVRLKDGRDGLLTGMYLVSVFTARFALEFFKMPQATYEAGNAISVGQLLSVPFVIVGAFLIFRSRLTLRTAGSA